MSNEKSLAPSVAMMENRLEMYKSILDKEGKLNDQQEREYFALLGSLKMLREAVIRAEYFSLRKSAKSIAGEYGMTIEHVTHILAERVR